MKGKATRLLNTCNFYNHTDFNIFMDVDMGVYVRVLIVLYLFLIHNLILNFYVNFSPIFTCFYVFIFYVAL